MSDSTQSLLTLRKLTRVLADQLRGQVTSYLATLTPLLRPRAVLGGHVQDGGKESSKRADKALKELQDLWTTVAAAQPFVLTGSLTTPLDAGGATLEIHPFEYVHEATHAGETRTVKIRCPLKWVLTYTGFAPSRLDELRAERTRTTNDEVARFVLHYLTLHVVIANQPGLLQMMEALHFPFADLRMEDLGALPVTTIASAISTRRPSDDVLIQTADVSGMDVFEEVVVVEDIARLADPLKERMLDAVRTHTPDLLRVAAP